MTERKHFYRTEVYQVQDLMLATDESMEDVNMLVNVFYEFEANYQK